MAAPDPVQPTITWYYATRASQTSDLHNWNWAQGTYVEAHHPAIRAAPSAWQLSTPPTPPPR